MTEKGLETIMVEYLRDHNGYEQGQSADFDREYTLDPGRVERFIRSTQPEKVEQTMCFGVESQRRVFFRRLSDKIAADGITNVLRKGFRFNGLLFDLYYPIPSELNPSAIDFYQRNIFSVTRQLHHSAENALDALDVCIFINGFPIITAELKNHYTGQNVKNAIKQYQDDRPATDPLFTPRRCAVHFAIDDEQIMMCTELKGKDSWFLPFNKGVNGGAGNPWKDSKILTEYLWQEVLTKDSLATASRDSLAAERAALDSLAVADPKAYRAALKKAEKEARKKARAEVRARKDAEREAKWQEKERIRKEKEAAKERKKLEKLRAKKRKALAAEIKDAQREAAVFEEYRRKFEAKKSGR